MSVYFLLGTKRMYTFIRKELNIPFYCGQHKIDTWLNLILEAIQSRKIETVLEDIFTPVLNSVKQ